MIDPSLFGAKMDGITDDTAAAQAAIDAQHAARPNDVLLEIPDEVPPVCLWAEQDGEGWAVETRPLTNGTQYVRADLADLVSQQLLDTDAALHAALSRLDGIAEIIGNPIDHATPWPWNEILKRIYDLTQGDLR